MASAALMRTGRFFIIILSATRSRDDQQVPPFITGNIPGKGTQKIEVGLRPVSGRIVGTLLDAELLDHISANLYKRNFATAEWLIDQKIPFYREIKQGDAKILIPSQFPALPPGWRGND